MPNEYQVVYLASFCCVLGALLLASHYIQSTLLAAGYDVSNLILVGLPNHTIPMDFRALDVPGVGTYDLVALLTSPSFIAAAALVVLGTAAFYAKVFRATPSKPLDPNAWKEYPLQKKIKISPNTAIYRFKLPRAQDVLGLPIGQHISVSAEINGKVITRSYTPVSNDDDRGYFDLLIKTYEKGNISKHVAQLKIGDCIRVKGPKGNFAYRAGLTAHLSMIAGGTGITPMIQIIRAALRNPHDRTTVSLIYANVNQEDILLKDDLEELLDLHGARFKIFYVLNNPPPGWNGGVGFVTKEHIKERFPNPADTDSKILMCGPPPMISAMKKNLEELKYPVPNTISKLDHKIFVF